MPPPASATHDPALSQSSSAIPPSSSAAPGVALNNLAPGENPNGQQQGFDQNQILNIFRTFPGLFNKVEPGNLNKEDAAQTLSNLSQASFSTTHQLPVQQHQYPGPHPHHPGISDPGPSSHPRGPPNLGQLSAVAMQAAPVSVRQPQVLGQAPGQGQGQEMEEGASDADDGARIGAGKPIPNDGAALSTPTSGTGGRSRGGRSATMGSDEWSRQRKDNHKEVERRRRGNINEGINELGRIVPNGSGEKAKGAILSRAVQYIHHLKENEARNIEKWTLEKLLMDQAMGDLQTQLEDLRKLWKKQTEVNEALQTELETLRERFNIAGASGIEASKGSEGNGSKRKGDGEGEGSGDATEGERDGKRLRVD